MNRVTLWARLSDLMARDKVRENFNGCLAPRPVHFSGRGRSVRSGSSVTPFELRTPVAQLLLGGRRSQPRSLPCNEMSVLDGKLRQAVAGALSIWRYRAPRALPRTAAATIRL